MAEMNTVVEGKVKYREGKKWKPRWCVMKKPSPVADRLQVLLYKDVKDSLKGGHPKSNFPLDGFYGMESGICYDKETSVLAIICHKQITLMSFESRETLIQFEIKIRRSLGEEHQFPVRMEKVPSQSKVPLDLVRMHIHGQQFCLTSCVPPKILCAWNITDLRRFGIVNGKFCFKGGSHCGKGQGFHIMQTEQAAEVAEIIGLAGTGKVSTWKGAGRRQTSKRSMSRSEYLEPVTNVANDNFFKNFQNTQVYADQNFQEDNIWPRTKRHSISFTDYRRAKTYAEKQRLISAENAERERLMAIYDIPPRRVRKVEPVQPDRPDVSASNFKSSERHFYSNTQSERPSIDSSWTGEYNNNVMSYQVPMTMTPSNSNQSDASLSIGSMSSLLSAESVATTTTTTGSLPTNLATFPMSSSAPALCGYGSEGYSVSKYREHSQSVPGQIAEEVERMAGEQPREDFLHKLQQEEVDLEREMTLLDEILKVCRAEDVRLDDLKWSNRPPPLPTKSGVLRGVLGSRGSLDNISISSDCTHTRPVPGGYSSSALLSPNLVSKLKLIHDKSKMNAPLKYVNLEKFDAGEVDTNHVHLPAASSAPDNSVLWSDFLSTRSGYDNVPSVKSSNKENRRVSVSLPGSRENLWNICGSDSQLNLMPKNACNMKEPIYANETRCETPPPELPPKGPILRSKQKRVINAASRPPPPPPRPPDRIQSLQQQRQDKHRMQYQSPRQGVNPVTHASSPHEDNYFLMGSFEKEPNHGGLLNESQRLNESLSGRSVIPSHGGKSSKLDSSDCYMDMSGLIKSETASPVTQTDSLTSDVSVHLPRPKYGRSLSASGAMNKSSPATSLPQQQQQQKYPEKRPESISVSAGNSPREMRREPPIREQNYMLMSSMMNAQKTVIDNLQTLQIYLSSPPDEMDSVPNVNDGVKKELEFKNDDTMSKERGQKNTWFLGNVIKRTRNDAEDDMCKKPEIPFDNLLDFTINHETDAAVQAQPNGEKPASEGVLFSGKTPGFFTRLMRRNSKDRKSISQSQESLLYSSSSEPTIKEGMSILLESSSSGESSRSQSQQDLVLNPKDRSRSSSFPNRSGYITLNDSTSSSSTGISVLSQQSDLGATNSSLSSGTGSAHTGSNEGNLNCSGSESVFNDNFTNSSEVEGEVQGNYENQSFLFVGPIETESATCMKDNEQAIDSASLNDKANDDNGNSVDKDSNDHCGGKVFTVLSVQGTSPFQSSSKTDDEKLIELWHSTQSLNSEKSDKDTIAEIKASLTLPLDDLSPDQKANAIAKHISSLPPFVPPKIKSYPVKLSPVMERPTKKKLNLPAEPDDYDRNEVGTPVSPMSPALMKQQAKATLRITPPSEDEHGKIWIPRSNQKQPEPRVDTATASEVKPSSLVVNLSDLGEQVDDLSMSSVESNCCWEEAVRSSPAATILRPRYGKEYQKIERRRTITDDSNTTSPLATPQSPAGESVFTFEMSYTPTCGSSLSGYSELHSPKFAKFCPEQTSLSLGGESIHSPRAIYMNVDFTPPDSPAFFPERVPAEQLDPQLNYAEIDLSDTRRVETLSQSKKYMKTVEAESIEYSMIDMVATRAAQKARKEHAQNRDGSLRRDRFSSAGSAKERDRYWSTSSAKDKAVASMKERMGSVTLPSTKAERKQAAASSAAQSTSSVDMSM